MKTLHKARSLRRIILPLLKTVGPREITIKHHWTGDGVRLHFFRHRGYWYHGKQRERETMIAFSSLLGKGDNVVEVGGHIGYITLYFAFLVGSGGSVTVFEPSPDNLRYLRTNIASKFWIHARDEAVTNYTGKATLYTEDLTGQNSSLLQQYSMRDANRQHAFVRSTQSEVEVQCTSLDAYFEETDSAPLPALVKIDVEGAELAVLQGMKRILTSDNLALMVEITVDAELVVSLLHSFGFRLFRANGQPVTAWKSARGNVFCLKSDDPRIRFFLEKEA